MMSGCIYTPQVISSFCQLKSDFFWSEPPTQCRNVLKPDLTSRVFTSSVSHRLAYPCVLSRKIPECPFFRDTDAAAQQLPAPERGLHRFDKAQQRQREEYKKK